MTIRPLVYLMAYRRRRADGALHSSPPAANQAVRLRIVRKVSQQAAIALRVAAERSQRTLWHGAKGQMSLGVDSVSFVPMGSEAKVQNFRDSLSKPYARQAAELVQVLRGEQAGTSTGREHLLPMAVIEAAYLSARTGQPESPSHFYELHDLTPPTPPVISSPGG